MVGGLNSAMLFIILGDVLAISTRGEQRNLCQAFANSMEHHKRKERLHPGISRFV